MKTWTWEGMYARTFRLNFVKNIVTRELGNGVEKEGNAGENVDFEDVEEEYAEEAEKHDAEEINRWMEEFAGDQ